MCQCRFNYYPIIDSPPLDVNALHAAYALDVEFNAADLVRIGISRGPSRVLNEEALILIHLRGLAALHTEADGVGVQIIIGSGVGWDCPLIVVTGPSGKISPSNWAL